eukprot:1143859-Pelagomonas_calceolata.AAC.1
MGGCAALWQQWQGCAQADACLWGLEIDYHVQANKIWATQGVSRLHVGRASARRLHCGEHICLKRQERALSTRVFADARLPVCARYLETTKITCDWTNSTFRVYLLNRELEKERTWSKTLAGPLLVKHTQPAKERRGEGDIADSAYVGRFAIAIKVPAISHPGIDMSTEKENASVSKTN